MSRAYELAGFIAFAFEGKVMEALSAYVSVGFPSLSRATHAKIHLSDIGAECSNVTIDSTGSKSVYYIDIWR